jgi:hypothetical protein
MLFDPQLHADAGTPELQILNRRLAALEAFSNMTGRNLQR